MKPKKFFSFCAVGVNLENEIVSIHGAKIAESKEYVVGFATTFYVSKYGCSPNVVNATEDSIEALLKDSEDCAE